MYKHKVIFIKLDNSTFDEKIKYVQKLFINENSFLSQETNLSYDNLVATFRPFIYRKTIFSTRQDYILSLSITGEKYEYLIEKIEKEYPELIISTLESEYITYTLLEYYTFNIISRVNFTEYYIQPTKEKLSPLYLEQIWSYLDYFNENKYKIYQEEINGVNHIILKKELD